MKRIKIKSNPYAEQNQKCVSYQIWNVSTQQWSDITDSDITQDKYTRKFFSLKADEIVDQLIYSYGQSDDNNAIEIEFEGTTDEFYDLKSLCESRPEKILLKKSELYYENARDIYELIKRYFRDMKSIIEDHKREDDTIKIELDKFSDVIKDEVPICVVGNYSTGKSAFINALIGEELLPSSFNPTTAKIHKISKEKFDDRATICFKHKDESDENQIVLEFTKHENKVEKHLNISYDDELYGIINDAIDSCGSNKLIDKVNAVLSKFNKKEYAGKISDTIEIKVPFNKKSILSSDNNYLIIDTPGDDSASDTDHTEVVHRAMNNLSNGLPIYIANIEKIKSTSNKNLCDAIISLNELDSRFTMIIINKADEIRLNELNELKEDDKKDDIKNSPVPSRLYSMGIYFVSSIMALGAKTDGHFRVNFDEWEDQSAKYDETIPNKSRIVKLYNYNIMPKHIYKKAQSESEKLENRTYANSGMYCVERDIEKFAMFYSPFNKCHQSKLFIEELYNKTQKILEKCEEDLEDSQKQLYAELENKSSILNDTISNECNHIIEDAEADHISRMNEYCLALLKEDAVNDVHLTESKLKEKEALIKEMIESEDRYVEIQKEKEAAYNSFFGEKLHQNVDVQAFLNAFSGLKDIGAKEIQKYKAMNEKDKQAATKLFNDVNETYKAECDVIEQKIYEFSDNYWKNSVIETKNRLLKQVASMEGLSEEKQEMLDNQIRDYPNPIMPLIPPFKDMDQFANSLFGLIKLNNDLNKKKLSRFYNENILEEIQFCKENIHLKHMEIFKEWIRDLQKKFNENIVDLSKGLTRLQNDIYHKQAELDKIQGESSALKHYKDKIDDLISLHSESNN